MRKSKLLCVILTVCMLFSFVPLVAHAEGYTSDTAAVVDKKVARIGDEGTGTYYESLHDAIKAVKDNETVTLIADTTESQDLSTESMTFTLDGNDKTLNLTGNEGFSFYDSHVTIQKLTINRNTGSGAMFNVLLKEYNNNGATITLKSCTIEVGENGDIFSKTQVFDGAKDGLGITWNINDCTINAINDAFLVNDTHNVNTKGPRVTYNLKNSTITTTTKGQNGAVRCFNLTGSKPGDYVFNISEKSTIKVVNESSSKTPIIRCIYVNQTGSTAEINLASGATLELASGYSGCNKAEFINGVGDITVNDNGAKWKLNKTAVEQGAYYPKTSNSDDVLGWIIDGKLYKHTSVGKLPTLKNVPDDGITIQSVYFHKATDLTMKDGAAIRTEDPTGIRFVTHVSASLINTLSNAGIDVELGTYFTPTDKLNDYKDDFNAFLNAWKEGTNADGDKWVKVVRTKWAVESTGGSNNGMNDFYTCLYDIPASGYDTAISAMSYFKVTYADGTTAVFYTAYTKDNNSRSMKDVAEKAIEGGKGNDFLQSIVEA